MAFIQKEKLNLVNKNHHSVEKSTENIVQKPSAGRSGRLSFLKNKYLIAGAVFLVWMLFFDTKDIGSSIDRWKKYRDLQASEAMYDKQINETKAELGQLKTNAQTIEKYAREKYQMKKDNEDLFIVQEEKNGENN